MTLLDGFLAGRHRRSDQEFLPAALAILETPPSPVKVGMIWTICLLFACALAWSYFGKIDIIAVAQGKIQPAGRVKTIQPVEGGKVVLIHAANGQHAAQGDILFELDAGEAGAEDVSARAALSGFQAERLRRAAALAAVRSGDIDGSRSIAWPDEIPASTRARETRVLEGDLAQLSASLRSLDAQAVQKRAEETRLTETIVAQETLIATLQERVNMRSTLLGMGAGSKANVIDARENLETQATALVTQKGQLNEAKAAISVLAQEREKMLESFKADNSQKLAEDERQIDDLEQKAAKAHTRLGHMTIVSPVDGTIIGQSVTTLGQVVNPGEEILRIVPDGSDLEIEAYAENKDIGFIAAGQTAVVKIESFPFTRYGVLEAKVERVAYDAIPEPDAQSIEGNPAKSTKATFFGGAQRTQNLVFPVTLSPRRKFMEIDGTSVPLSSGMAVSVEVKTGKRRILEYLFSPLVQTVSSAMKER